MFTTEKISSNEFTGLLVFCNGELVTRVEQDEKSKELNCYVYSELTNEDFTHKIKIN